MVIEQKLLDEIATLEVQALKEGLEDPEMRRNPSFLEKVLKFLVQNNLKTTPETKGVRDIQRASEQIPDFPQDEVTIN